MIGADWVALAILVLALAIGALMGFGRTLKIFTSGIFGIVICVVLTYFFIGVVASWGFVQDILGQFTTSLETNGSGFCNFLLTIGIEKIVLAIILFIILMILRIVIVAIIKGVSESDNKVMKVFNKILGSVLFTAIILVLILLIMHLISIIGGDSETNFANLLDGSALQLDYIFENNPLHYIWDRDYGSSAGETMLLLRAVL